MVKIEEIVLIIVFLIAVGTGVWYVFGDSPTFEQGLIIFLLSAVMGIVINLAKIGSKQEYFEMNVKVNFCVLCVNCCKSFLPGLLLNPLVDPKSPSRKRKSPVKDSFNNIKRDLRLIKDKLEI